MISGLKTTYIIAGAVSLLIAQTSLLHAQSEPKRSWQFYESNDPENKGRLTARLTYGIPETDDVQLTGVCDGTPSTGAAYSSLAFGTPTGKLKDGKEVELQFSGGGFSHKLKGFVAGTQAEQGVSGVEADVAHDDPLWSALLANETLDYFIPGYSSNRLDMREGRENIKTFVETCKAYAQAIAGGTTAQAGGTGANGLTEKEAFDLAKELGTAEAWTAFLTNFPTGFRADLAKAYLNKLGGTAVATPAVPLAPLQPPSDPETLAPEKPKTVVGRSRVRISQSCTRQSASRVRCRVTLRNTGNKRPSGRVSFRAIGEVLVGPGEGTLQLAARNPDQRSWRCSRLPANSLNCSISGSRLRPGRSARVTYTINVRPLRRTSRYLVEGCARLGSKGRFVCDRVRGPRLASRAPAPRGGPGCRGGTWRGSRCVCPAGTIFDAGRCTTRDHGGVNCAGNGQVYHNGACRNRCPSGFENVRGFCERNDELRAGDRCGPGFRWSRAKQDCVSRFGNGGNQNPVTPGLIPGVATPIVCVGGRVRRGNCVCPPNRRKISRGRQWNACVPNSIAGGGQKPQGQRPPKTAKVPPCPLNTKRKGKRCVSKQMVCNLNQNNWQCVSRNPPTNVAKVPPCPFNTKRTGNRCLSKQTLCNLRNNNWECVSRNPPTKITIRCFGGQIVGNRCVCPPGARRVTARGGGIQCTLPNQQKAGQDRQKALKAAQEAARRAAQQAAQQRAAQQRAQQKALKAAQDAARKAQQAAQRAAQQRAAQQRAAQQKALKAAQEAARKAQQAAQRAAAQQAARQKALKAAQDAARKAQQAAQRAAAQKALKAAQDASRKAQQAAQQRAAQQRAQQKALKAAQDAARKAQQAAQRAAQQRAAQQRAAQQKALKAARDAARKAQQAAQRAAQQRAAQQRAAQQRAAQQRAAQQKALKAAQDAARRAQQAAQRAAQQRAAQQRAAQQRAAQQRAAQQKALKAARDAARRAQQAAQRAAAQRAAQQRAAQQKALKAARDAARRAQQAAQRAAAQRAAQQRAAQQRAAQQRAVAQQRAKQQCANRKRVANQQIGQLRRAMNSLNQQRVQLINAGQQQAANQRAAQMRNLQQQVQKIAAGARC